MGMEPFDYLTYKRNKIKNTKESVVKKDKFIVAAVCFTTFLVIFLFVMSFIASKSAKIDIEYGRLGKNTTNPAEIENKMAENYNEQDETLERREKYTIDKRLFLISQEEKGPSESKVVSPPKEQAEVISKKEFEIIKTNSDEVVQKAEKQIALKPPVVVEENKENINPAPIQTGTTKAVIKPKLPVKPEVKPLGAFEAGVVPSKVLIGRYSTIEEARKAQTALTNVPDGVVPFVKRINNYYSLQIGAFDSFDMAKAVAGKFKAKGYDVWILQ